MNYRILGKTGMRVSTIGFGAAPLGNEYGTTDSAEIERAVAHAIDQGINFFDVAPYYGRKLAEQRLGEALQGRRQKIILASKCGRYGKGVDECDYSARCVIAGIDESLLRLKTDYVDLIQVHDVEMVLDPEQVIHETIPALRRVVKAGKARWVGITGLPLKLLRYVAAKVEVDTVLSFCHYNLMITDLDESLAPHCQSANIGLINASPLHMGLLTTKGGPEWHPASIEVKAACRRVVAACEEAGAEVSSVALRFALDHPTIATTLIGMSTCQEVEKNVGVLGIQNDGGLLRRLKAIIEPVKNASWLQGRRENNDAHWRERGNGFDHEAGEELRAGKNGSTLDGR